MAVKYWYVASNGSTNWATASCWYNGSGGTGGTTSVPTATDDVILNAASGTGSVTIAAAATCASLDCRTFRGTLAGTSTLAVTSTNTSNSFYFGASMSLTYSGTITISGPPSFFYFYAAGKTITCNLTVSLGIGSYFYFADPYSVNTGIVNFSSTSTLTLLSGYIGLSAQGYAQTFNVGLFSSSGTNARTIYNLGGNATFNIIGVGTIWNVSGTSFGIDSVVYITDQSSSAKVISNTATNAPQTGNPNTGGGYTTWPGNILITGSGTGSYTITGNLGLTTFNNTGVAPVSFGTSNIYGNIDFTNSYANLNNGVTTITFIVDSTYFIIGPYTTITASPLISISNAGSDYIYFFNYSTQALTQGITINAPGSSSGINSQTDFRLTGTLTLTQGVFISNSGNTYIGSISTSAATTRTFQVGTLYLIGTGTTITGTTTTNLTWSTGDIYLVSSSAVARSTIFNSIIYPTGGQFYLSGTSSGSLTYAPAVGTPTTFGIYVTNTGGATVNISTTTNISTLDFGTSNVVWNNGVVVVTFWNLYLSPNMTVTACPTLTWNGSSQGEIRCYGKSLTNLTVNDTNLLGQSLYILGDLYVSGVLTYTSGNFTAQNQTYGSAFSGLDRGFVGPSYLPGANEDVYIGSLTINGTSSTQTKNWTSKDVYFTASGAVLTATSFANLTWSVNNMNVVVKDAVARSITPNSTIYPTNNQGLGYWGKLIISGTGSATTTITPGTFSGYDVLTTNTGSGVISFATGTIGSLIFSSGNTVWNNAITQTLTLQGNLIVSSAGNFTLTPALIFTGVKYYGSYNEFSPFEGYTAYITMGGKSLVTGAVTINDTTTSNPVSMAFTFTDTFTLNSAFTVTSANSVNFNGRFIGTATTISLVATNAVYFNSSCSVSSTITTTNSATYSNQLIFSGTASFTTLTHNATGYLGFGATATFTTLSLTNASAQTYIAGPLIASTSIVLTNGTNMYININYNPGFFINWAPNSNLTITCPTFTMTNGNLYLTGTASITGALTLTAGSINISYGFGTNSYVPTDFNLGSFTSTGAAVRSILGYGTGKFNITGTGTVWSVSGSNFSWGSTIYVTDSSATGKTLAHSPTGDILSVTTTGSGTGTYTMTGNFATVLFNNTAATTVTFGASVIYLIDFGTSINNWNNTAVTVTFNQLYLSPNMTVTVCPTLLWNSVITSTIGLSGEIRCYGKSITNLTVNDTVLAGYQLNITGDLYISGTLTLTSGNILAVNYSGATFSGSDRGFVGPTYSLYAAEDMYIGNFTSAAGSGTRSISCKNMYFTSVTATTLTSVTNLSPSIVNMYLTNSSGSARAITLSAGFYPTNAVYIAGTAAGTTTITPGTTGGYDVIVSNTGAGVVSFATGAIKSLIFATGSNAIWTNAVTQTLTIQNNMTVYSAGNFTLTPNLTFNGLYNTFGPTTSSPSNYNCYITLGGKSLVTGVVTINDTAYSANVVGFVFTDNFSTDQTFTITSAGYVVFNGNMSAVGITSTSCILTTTNKLVTLSGSITLANNAQQNSLTLNGTSSLAIFAHNAIGTVIVNAPMTASTSITLNNTSAGFNHSSLVSTPAFTITQGTLVSNSTLSVTGTLNLATGTIQVNGSNNYNLGFFVSSGSTVRTITMGNGIWTLTGTGTPWNIVATSLTLNPNGSLINITDTSSTAITFAGGSTTYYGLQFNRGGSTASITLTGNNTFTNFIDIGTATHSLLFTAASTQTIGNFVVIGNPAGQIILNSTTTAAFTLTKSPAGLVNCDYLNIQHCIASPSTLTWYAGTNSVNNQAVVTAGSGWIFTNMPPRKLGAGGVG